MTLVSECAPPLVQPLIAVQLLSQLPHVPAALRGALLRSIVLAELFVPEPVSVVSVGAVLATLLVTVVVANLLAAIPARIAARTQPAVALRAE